MEHPEYRIMNTFHFSGTRSPSAKLYKKAADRNSPLHQKENAANAPGTTATSCRTVHSPRAPDAPNRKKSLLSLLGRYRSQLLCLLAGLLLYLSSAFLTPEHGALKHGRYLPRGGYGDMEQRYTVTVEGLSKEAMTLDIPVAARSYLDSELENIFTACMDTLAVTIPGNNTSLAEIRSDLSLPSYVEQYGIRENWISSDPELLSSFGTVYNEELTEARDLSLTACLSDVEGRRSRSYELPLTVLPPELSQAELRQRAFLRFLHTLDIEQSADENLTLPQSYEGQPLSYRQQTPSNSWIFLILGAVTALLLLLRDRERVGLEAKMRQRQMLLDYPEIVSKLMIFIGAGMTIRLAWASIVADYERDLSAQSKPTRHHAYEEMALALAKLKTGCSEGKVYHEFGRRCGLRQYMKLAGILEQNRRTGVANIRQILSAEVNLAWEERKNLARRMGEEAGTKLLAPLFIMLIIVMAMIVVPAMLSF